MPPLGPAEKYSMIQKVQEVDKSRSELVSHFTDLLDRVVRAKPDSLLTETGISSAPELYGTSFVDYDVPGLKPGHTMSARAERLILGSVRRLQYLDSLVTQVTYIEDSQLFVETNPRVAMQYSPETDKLVFPGIDETKLSDDQRALLYNDARETIDIITIDFNS